MAGVAFELTSRLRQRVDTERILWLITVSPSGQPAPRPVWFIWDGEAFVVYTFPDSAKVAHIRANPKVAVHFNADFSGAEVDILSGLAEVVTDPQPPSGVPAYREKYEPLVPEIGLTMAQVDEFYSVSVRVTPHRVWDVG